MGSINPQRVATKVIETIARGEKVDLEDIIISVGYAKATAHNPSMVTSSKAYKKTMALQSRPLVDGLAQEINRLKLAIEKRDLSKEEYKTLIQAIDVLTRNFQLLSGGATERQVFVLPSEVMERNDIKAVKEGSTKPPNESVAQ